MKQLLLIFLLLVLKTYSKAQGCSDPGICTIGTLNSDNIKDTVSSLDYKNAEFTDLLNARVAEEKFRLDLGFVYNKAEKNTSIIQTLISVQIRVSKKKTILFRIPFSRVSGTLGNVANLGDLTLAFQNTFVSGKSIRLSYIVGGVLPSNNSNLTIDGNPLPMAYQTSLGVFNAFGGLSGTYKTWKLSAGYQHSFGKNGNTFTTENLVLSERSPGFDPLNKDRASYLTSKHLDRGSDLFLRLEKRFNLKKINAFVGVLPIFRLRSSNMVSAAGERLTANGSGGLTFNVNLAANYNITNNWIVRANYGFPIKQRDLRPDGLTRNSVSVLGLIYRFW